MSTRWGYQCMTHDPPICSEKWGSNSATREELADIWAVRRLIRRLVKDFPAAQFEIEALDTGKSGPVWVVAHVNCAVQLINEYGDTEPINRPPGEAKP